MNQDVAVPLRDVTLHPLRWMNYGYKTIITSSWQRFHSLSSCLPVTCWQCFVSFLPQYIAKLLEALYLYYFFAELL